MKFHLSKQHIAIIILLPFLFINAHASTDTIKIPAVVPARVTQPQRKKKDVEVLKFKSPTTNGQILSPGQKPPATTLAESEKIEAAAVAASTPTP